jgi:phosphate ABC transporter permease protein PstC
LEAASLASGGRSTLERSSLARLPDRALKYGLTALAAAILALIVYFFIRLVGEAAPAFEKEGVLGFTFGNDWNVNANKFGALPLLVGTLITSALALIMGVPVAVAAAVYVTELCPRRIRAPVTVLIELLAAVPSVVYGLWGIFFLAPKLQPAEQWVADRLSGVPFIGGGIVTIPNYFITGLVLAIMILPIVSSISREVMSTVPDDHKEAALGLGATRWEMIRLAVLPYCRTGITGAAMLGLGRAIGETIAVTILIGDAPQLSGHLFGQGCSDRQRVRRGPGTAPQRPVRRRARAVRADPAGQRDRAAAGDARGAHEHAEEQSARLQRDRHGDWDGAGIVSDTTQRSRALR